MARVRGDLHCEYQCGGAFVFQFRNGMNLIITKRGVGTEDVDPVRGPSLSLRQLEIGFECSLFHKAR